MKMKKMEISNWSRNIQAAMESVSNRKKYGSINRVDFSRAFDSINHCHVFKAIKRLLSKKLFTPVR
uniref:Reverse transcriptase domain-containing protein n=1 Tax=Lepeophtheirus salmonis TaxID=72036 RepID=A0A0K2VC69_LEPSM